MTKILAAVSLALSLLGCSSSTASNGADAWGGGPTADQACADSAHAKCTRLQTCSAADVETRYGDEQTCESREKRSCANALAAPGNGNNPTKTEACSQEYATWSCTDYLDTANVPAACKQASGSVADGAACAFAGQCASGFCAIVPGSACGTCGAPPSPGASCAQLTNCGQGLVCTFDTQVCVVYAASGAPCGKGAPCGAGLSCVGADAATATMGTCQAAVAASGATCDASQKTGPGCDRNLGLQCNSMSKQCATLTFGAGGQPCDDVNNQFTPCSASGQCSTTMGGMAGTCTAAAADGAACDVMAGPPCLNPARCVVGSGGGTAGTCQLQSSTACH
jgi:hypothetical protein